MFNNRQILRCNFYFFSCLYWSCHVKPCLHKPEVENRSIQITDKNIFLMHNNVSHRMIYIQSNTNKQQHTRKLNTSWIAKNSNNSTYLCTIHFNFSFFLFYFTRSAMHALLQKSKLDSRKTWFGVSLWRSSGWKFVYCKALLNWI